MLPDLPLYVPLLFILTTLAKFILFVYVLKKSTLHSMSSLRILIAMIVWLALQGVIAKSGFFAQNLDVLPPRFILVVVPPFLVIIILFLTRKGLRFIDQLPLYQITWLNVVRIPVEIGLFYLAMGKAIPELMTFAGRNFDIIAGITAPIIAYFGIKKSKIGKVGLLVWNIAMLALLVNIIVNALLAAPTPLQQFAFDTPNIGVLYFPYSWLPGFIVPVVFFGHLVSIRRLLKE